jgi:hypothetical protein
MVVDVGRDSSTTRYLKMCSQIAKQYPKWSIAQVEAEATLRSLGLK